MSPLAGDDQTVIQPTRPPTAFGSTGHGASDHRAEPPRAPALTPALLKAEDERQKYLQSRGAVERRSMLRGLILLAVMVLLIALIGGGVQRAFPAGWWGRW